MFGTDITDFYAAVFLLAIAIIFIILGLIFKKFWLYIVSMFCWIIVGTYCFLKAPELSDSLFINALGVLSVVAAFLAILAGVGARRDQKKALEPPPVAITPYREKIRKRISGIKERMKEKEDEHPGYLGK